MGYGVAKCWLMFITNHKFPFYHGYHFPDSDAHYVMYHIVSDLNLDDDVKQFNHDELIICNCWIKKIIHIRFITYGLVALNNDLWSVHSSSIWKLLYALFYLVE